MLSALTPPDGMNDISVNGAVRARMAAGPPSRPAGKNLTSVNPRPTAVISSEAVATPGNAGTPSSADRASTGTDNPGLTTNCAPASTTSSTCAGTSTEPAPTWRLGRAAARIRIASIPAAVRKVISTTSTPPASSASPSGTAWAASWITTTGTIGHLVSSDCELICFSFPSEFRASSDDVAGQALLVQVVPGGEPLPVAGDLADGPAEPVAHGQAR